MTNKQLLGIVGYFCVTILVSISDKITPEFKWSDLIQPHVLFPAIVSGVVTVTAYKSNSFHTNADKPTEDSDPELQ